MEMRIKNPAYSVAGVLDAMEQLAASATKGDVPITTHFLVWLRASQVNGCSVCVDIHSRELILAGEPPERVYSVAAWRESSYFTEAERAALALAEAATRLADQVDPVPDVVWEEATSHYSEAQLAALVVSIAEINAWNRLMVVTRQVSGDWVKSATWQSRLAAA